ncbi:MAG TPA: ATP-binding protein [Tepidisphaeraceae bacterium]
MTALPADTLEPDTSFPERQARPFPPVRAPRIVLTWLLRLRWIAVAGQLVATGVALLLGLNAPVWPVAAVALITALSNGIFYIWLRTRPIPTRLILLILLADMCLLTVLLHYTGGPDNPFCTLYLVHVAMAVTTLGGAWTWIVLGAAALLYASQLVIPSVPLTPGGTLPPLIRHIGTMANLVLIGGLIGYFSGRVNRSLRWREVHINALRERNARNEKLTTLTTLAAGAAHELGTPLATIAVVARELELAIAKQPGSEDLIDDARLIRQECDRCRFILDRMRVDVASDPRAGRTELDELLARLEQHLRDDERERLQIVGPLNGFAIAAPCPAIEQSLTVMIRNGMEADAAGQPVRLVIRPDGDSIAFDVLDRGHGMTSDVLKRAGEPFFTTKEPGRGMGLGLFLVRLVAENYRGKFTMTSQPGEGTQSTLEFPMDSSLRVG